MAGELTSFWLARGRGVVMEGGVVPPNQITSRVDGTAIKSRVDETPLQSRAA
jgi:hypothetical protein